MAEWIFVAASQIKSDRPMDAEAVGMGLLLALVVVIACIIWERFDR